VGLSLSKQSFKQIGFETLLVARTLATGRSVYILLRGFQYGGWAETEIRMDL
jgi:hypothetical protein